MFARVTIAKLSLTLVLTCIPFVAQDPIFSRDEFTQSNRKTSPQRPMDEMRLDAKKVSQLGPTPRETNYFPSIINPFSPGTGMDTSSIFLGTPSYSSGAQSAVAIAVGDVNGDGKPDLMVANQCLAGSCGGGTVGVLLGNGDGTFQGAVQYSSIGQQPSSIALADVNNDGKPDLLVTDLYGLNGNSNGAVSVLLGNGDGTFKAAIAYDSGAQQATSVAVGDVNGDGKQDLVVTNQCLSVTNCNGTVGVLLGNGDGTFNPATLYSSGGQQATSVAIGDVNGDGKQDIVVTNQCVSVTNCNGTVGVLLGNGDGTLKSVMPYTLPGQRASSVALADVNNDGKLDLLVAVFFASSSDTNGAINILLGNGDGTFQPPAAYASGGQQATSIAAMDVNGDGNADVLVTNSYDNKIGVLLGIGNGTFKPAQVYGPGGQDPVSLAAADLNMDGKADLAVVNRCITTGNCQNLSTGSVGVLLGNGDGSFQAAPAYGSDGQQAFAVAVGDVNGDGNPDLVISNIGDKTVGVLLGNADGTFSAPSAFSSGGGGFSVTLADVNNDGKLDILVPNYFGSSNSSNGAVSVLLGNGDGTFQTAKMYDSGGQNPLAIAVGDVNGDGKPDLVVADFCNSGYCLNGVVAILFGNGDGTFQTAVPYASGWYGAVSVAIGDVNQDGKPDLVVGNSCRNCASDVASILLGNGNGTFQAAMPINPGGFYLSSVAVQDVNRDGKLDLLVASACVAASDCTHSAIGVLLGNGNGSFQAVQTTAVPLLSDSPVVADFNGDGNLDIASGSGDFLVFGNGDGSFQSPLTLGATGTGTASGDFNHDGKPDLAIGGVTVLLNQFRYATTSSIASSANPVRAGQPVVFTSTVTAAFNRATLSGNVTFYDGLKALATVGIKNGMATFHTSSLVPGNHSITAAYGGDQNYLTSTSPRLQQSVMVSTATKIVTSQNPSFINTAVIFKATITSTYGPIPDGDTVTFYDGPTAMGTARTTGATATFTTSKLTRGVHAIKASYSGDVSFKPSSGVTKQTVNLYYSSTNTPTSSLNPSVYGQSVTFSSTVSSTAPSAPTGTVTFKSGVMVLGNVPVRSGGLVTLTKNNLPVGSHSITAVYNGDSETAKSTSPVYTQNVTKGP